MVKSETSNQNAIAIIGIGCRFPGNVVDTDSYWSFLLSNKDAMCDIPANRWDMRRFYDPDPAKPGKLYVKRGGFLQQDIYDFDANFFGISPREAVSIDPQQRLLLEVSWEALEDAGINTDDIHGSNTGVFIGGFTLDNMLTHMGSSNRHEIGQHTAVSSTMTILSNRLSYVYNLKGPSISIDTACSSSLVAFHYACQSILQGDCDVAMAGGVNIMLRPEYPIAMCKGQFLSPDGRCHSFDSRANGYARGEGAGIVLLKPLEKALQDGDRIYATVLGTGVNQDGRTDGITVPNGDSQRELAQKVQQLAGIDPHDIAYVEAHGTGTPVGDPIEARALGESIGKGRDPEQPLYISSVKSAIGHLEAASGIAGVIKTALSLKHGVIPPLVNLESPNPDIPFDELGIKLPAQQTVMPRYNGSRLAAINSFGYGGTNAHAVLQEPPEVKRNPMAVYNITRHDNSIAPATLPVEQAYTFTLSAKNDSALTALIEQHKHFVENNPDYSLETLCNYLSNNRTHHSLRFACTANNREELVATLQTYLKQGAADFAITNKANEESVKSPVFVFTGMGPQWWAMGQDLYHSTPVFRDMADRCDAIFQQLAGWSILAEMLKPQESSRITDTEIAQPANFVLQASLFALLKSWNISPAAIVGHSVGEVSAAYASGVLSLEEAVTVSYQRSRIQKTAAGTGSMLAVGLTQDEVNALIDDCKDKVSIAAINSQNAITLAGDTTQLEAIASMLDAKGIFNRFLKVEVPYHSPQMEALKPELIQSLKHLTPKTPATTLYSTVSGQQVEGISYDAHYWCDNVREPVLFEKAINSLLEDGFKTFIEIGPHPVLAGSIKEAMMKRHVQGITLSTLNRKQQDVTKIYHLLAELHSLGYQVEWHAIYDTTVEHIKLPNYPWQRERFWNESDDAYIARVGNDNHPLISDTLPSPFPTWETSINSQYFPYLRDHCVDNLTVLPGAAYVETALAAQKEISGMRNCLLDNIQFHNALIVDANDEPVMRTAYDPTHKKFTIHSRTRDDNSDWTLHATGKMSPLPNGASSNVIDLAELQQQITENVAIDLLYQQLTARGLQYGPMFQGIKKLWRNNGQALAIIKDQSETHLKNSSYLLHPAILDACFQSLIVTLESTSDVTYMPVEISQLVFYNSPKSDIWCHSHLSEINDDSIKGNITLTDQQGNVLVEVNGLVCKALNANKIDSTDRYNNWFYQFDWQKNNLESAVTTSAKWLIFGDNCPLREKLIDELSLLGCSGITVVSSGNQFTQEGNHYQLDLLQEQQIDKLLQTITLNEYSGIAWFDSEQKQDARDDNVGMDNCVRALNLVKALERDTGEQSPRIYFITQNAQVVPGIDTDMPGLSQASLVGLSRVAFNEHPKSRCTLIDIDRDSHFDDNLVTMLARELVSDSKDDDVAIRHDGRYVHRLLRSQNENDQADTITLHEDDHFLLILNDRYLPGGAYLQQTVRPAVTDTDVVIKINAITAPGEFEALKAFSGTVVETGSGVTNFRTGDRCVGLTDQNISSHITISSDNPALLRLSRDVNDVQTAPMYLPMLTATYGLKHIARISQQQTIVVTDTQPDICQAVIQQARRCNATVIVATTGLPLSDSDPLDTKSNVDWQQLGAHHVINAFDLNIASNIKPWVQDQGIDLIFDTSAHSVAENFLKFIRMGGYIIQTSHAGHNTDSTMNIADNSLARHKGIIYSYFDIEKILSTNPGLMSSLQSMIVDDLENGFPAMSATKIYPVSKIVNQEIAANELTEGKIVIDLQDSTPLQALPLQQKTTLFKQDASYMITGAFGGFGLYMAQWMVDNGANNLVLVGRSGAKTEQAKTVVKHLQKQGVNVNVQAADVGNIRHVETLFQRVISEMPTLKGVFHAAAVLDDAPISELNAERFNTVMTPKAQGAWNLHLLTRDLDLDIFLLFSSVSSLIGNARQANYVAANSFQDSLAHYRRTLGLKATSINWGVLANVGMGASNETLEKHLALMGISAFKAQDAMSALKLALESDPTQMGIMDVDWQRWAQFEPTGGASPRFSELVVHASNEADSEVSQLRNQLLELELEQRKEMSLLLLTEIIANSLRLSADKIDTSQSLNNLGADSLMAVELQTGINIKFGVEFSALELLRGKTINQLTESLMEKMNILTPNSKNTEPNVISEGSIDNLDEKNLDKLLRSMANPAENMENSNSLRGAGGAA